MSDMVFPIYTGWVYGDPDDRATLEGLGVQGEMTWRASSNRESMTAAARTRPARSAISVSSSGGGGQIALCEETSREELAQAVRWKSQTRRS